MGPYEASTYAEYLYAEGPGRPSDKDGMILNDLRTAKSMLSEVAERMRVDRIPMPLDHYAALLEHCANAVATAIRRHSRNSQ